MVVGFDADSLGYEVMGEPGEVSWFDSIHHVANFGFKVRRGEIVDDEEDFVGGVLVGGLGIFSIGVDVNRSECRSFGRCRGSLIE